jgi:hypothetical protein
MDPLIHASLIKNLDCELELVRRIVVAEVNAFLEIFVAHQPSYRGLLVYLLFMGYLLQELGVLLDLWCGFKLYEVLRLHYD